MADCLLECLREAKLEKYHRNFVSGGLQYCDALVQLSMQEYPKYGVVSMDDRLKLFKLIQIVKSVQSEGLVCRNGHHSHSEDRRLVVNNRNKHSQGRSTIANKGAKGPIVSRRMLPQEPRQTVQPDAPLKRSASMRIVRQPDAPLRRSASMRFPKMQGPPKRSSSATRVEYKPDSDSPIFHCRRHLRFTDSDLESDEEDLKKLIDELSAAQTNVEKDYVKRSQQKLPHTTYPREPSGNAISTDFCSREKSHSDRVVDNKKSKCERVVDCPSGVLNGNGPLQTVFEPAVRAFDFATNVKTKVSPIDVPVERLHINNQPSPFELESRKRITASDNMLTGAFFCDVPAPAQTQKPSAISNRLYNSHTGDVIVQNTKNTADSRAHSRNTIPAAAAAEEVRYVNNVKNARNHCMPITKPSEQSQPFRSCSDQHRHYSHQDHFAHDTHEHATLPTAPCANLKAALPSASSCKDNNCNVNNGINDATTSSRVAAGVRPFQHSNQTKRSAPEMHSYFRSGVTESDTKQEVDVEKVYHTAGYDYGVPRGDNYSTQSRSVENARKADRGSSNGRIHVCARKRPLLRNEIKQGERDVIKTDQNVVTVDESKLSVDLSKFVHQHIFRFDDAFGASCDNEAVYSRAVKPLVQCAFNKSTATCFAFGQTGSGKSYTLLGNPVTPGLYQLASSDVFDTFANVRANKHVELHLWVSYYEIYCSQLFDLLNKRKKLHVRENSRGKVCIAGLMETEVTSVKGLVEVVQYGNAVRSTGVSGVNQHSSRSHAILQLEVRDDKDAKQGRLSFIDLAGSERATDMPDSDKQTRLEGAEINQSLLALKECIRSIDQDNRHTPYRQSKLTHILRDSFLGNSRTVMIANISPAMTSCEHTLNTLRYADRVKELDKVVGKPSPKASRNSQPPTPVLSLVNNKTTTQQQQQKASKSPKRVPAKPAASRSPVTNSPKPSTTRQAPPASFSRQIQRDHVMTAKAASIKQSHDRVESKLIGARNDSPKPYRREVARNQVASPGNPLAVNSTKRGLFAPANIIYASTPKKLIENVPALGPLGSPCDVSKIMKDDAGTPPVAGHRLYGERSKVLEESPEIVPVGVNDVALGVKDVAVGIKDVAVEVKNGAVAVNKIYSEKSTDRLLQEPQEAHNVRERTSFERQDINVDVERNSVTSVIADSNRKLLIDTERVNELVQQQRNAFYSEQQLSGSPLAAATSAEHSADTREQVSRGRRAARSVSAEDDLAAVAHQRSKSIESLRSSLRHQFKSTPALNTCVDGHAYAQVGAMNDVHKCMQSKEAGFNGHSTRALPTTTKRLSDITAPDLIESAECHGKPNEGQSSALSSRSDVSSKSHEDIMTEHRNVLVHLDTLLDRAKVAVLSPDRQAVPEFTESNDSRPPLKSILKNTASFATSKASELVADSKQSTEGATDDVTGAHAVSNYEQVMEICDAKLEKYGFISRHSDPIIALGQGARPKEHARSKLLESRSPLSINRQSSVEFLKNLADIKLQNQRQSLSSSGNVTRNSSKSDTPGEKDSTASRNSATKTPGHHLQNSASNYVTPAVSFHGAAGSAIQNTGNGSSPWVAAYNPPPAPRKTHSTVNRAANDLGFAGELERLERCSSQNSESSLTTGGKNKSWHDILSQSSDDEKNHVADVNQAVNHASREGSLELFATPALDKPRAVTKDTDALVIETNNGRSTVDSGIGTHMEQSDAGLHTRTNSQGSHYSLDLHSLHSEPEGDLHDDGISLSGDAAKSRDTKMNFATNLAPQQQNHRIGILRQGHLTRSIPRRHVTADDDDEELAYIPPLKLNFDVDDDELEESYCRIVESEKREAEERAKRNLRPHQDSAFTTLPDANQKSSEHQNVSGQKTSEIAGVPTVGVTSEIAGPTIGVTSEIAGVPTVGVTSENAVNQSNGQTLETVAQAQNRKQFSPIHPYPITRQDSQHVLKVPKLVTKVPSATTTESDVALSSRSVDSENPLMTDTETRAPRPAMPLSARTYEQSGYATSHQRLNSCTFDVEQKSQNLAAAASEDTTQAAAVDNHVAVLQNQLMLSHEEQLSQMTALCKQEMKLLMNVKASNQNFNAYVRELEEILSDKGRCILHLKAQIDSYLNATQST